MRSNFIFNSLLMRFPFSGTRLSARDYFKGSATDHLIGIFGGAVRQLGMSFNIIASGMAGSAIPYGLGQGATIVAVRCGILYGKSLQTLL